MESFPLREVLRECSPFKLCGAGVLTALVTLVLTAAPVWADPPKRPKPAPAAPPVSLGPPVPLPAVPVCLAAQPVPAFVPLDFTAAPAPGPTLTERVVEQVAALGRRAEETHDRLERGIMQQVLRLDDFFGKANNLKEQHTAYQLRWRNSLRWQQGSGLDVGSTLRANLELSRINDRLQLAISGAGKPDQTTPTLPEDPGNPGFDRTLRNARIVNTELRYQLMRTSQANLFLGTGFDLALPPEFFARARYQRLDRVGQHYLLHFGETIFVKNPDGFGETTELSAERSLDPKTLARLALSGTVSQEIKALEWGTELSLLRELSPRSAVTVTGGVYGNTSIDDWVTNYRVLATYRRNFLRPWLFYELEPQVAWPRSEDGRFPTTFSVTVRLEIVFQGNERKLVPPP